MIKFPNMTLDVSLERGLDCSSCRKFIAPFKTVFILAERIGTNAGKPLCGSCSVEEMKRREKIVAGERGREIEREEFAS